MKRVGTIKNATDMNLSKIRTNFTLKWEYDDEGYVVFEYDADGRIKTIEDNYWEDYLETSTLTWEERKVIMDVSWGGESISSRYVFTLNSDGQIEQVDQMINYSDNWFPMRNLVYNWDNGNVVKIEQFVGDYDYDYDCYMKSMMKEGIREGSLRHKFSSRRQGIATKVLSPIVKSSSNDSHLVSTLNSSFDNKYNPFSRHQALRFYISGEPIFLSKNNPTSVNHLSEYSSENWTNTYIWKYNSKDYPSSAVVDYMDFCEGSDALEFTYSNCN